MDWGKSKTILIVAFLILNIFLAYRLWLSPGNDELYFWIMEEEKEEVISYLEENNITFEGRLKQDIETKNFYRVENKHFSERDFFDGVNLNKTDFERAGNENSDFYIDGKGRVLSIFNSGKKSFYFPGGYVPDNLLVGGSLCELINSAIYWTYKEFFDRAFDLENVYLDEINYREDRKVELIFHQELNGSKFFGGYFKLLLTSAGIVEGQLFLLDFKGESENSIEVIPATTALLRVVSHLPSGERHVIKELRLGYYTQELYAESWEAVPVWEVSLKEGGKYYLNAFTGELEGKREKFENWQGG